MFGIFTKFRYEFLKIYIPEPETQDFSRSVQSFVRWVTGIKYCKWLRRDQFFTENFSENGPKLAFEARHTPFNVGIVTNVSNFEEGVCFVTNSDENELVQKFWVVWNMYRVVPMNYGKKVCWCFSSDGNQWKRPLRQFWLLRIEFDQADTDSTIARQDWLSN